MKTLLATASVLAALAAPASAMEFKMIKAKTPGHVALIMQGMIEYGDGKKMIATIQNYPDQNAIFDTVILDSFGGHISDSAIMSEVVREFKATTLVVDGAVCQSACFEIFSAGEHRVVGSTAKIGVHRLSNEGEDDVTKSHTIDYAARVSKYGVPKQILASMMMTPPDDMYILTPADLASMHVEYYDTQTASSAPVPAPPQSSYQLSYNDTTPTPAADPQDLRSQRRAEFDETFSKAVEVSKAQNRGRAAAIKNCDQKGCEIVLGYKDAHGYYVELHKSLNSDSRALCRLTQPGLFEDTYVCRNWLTKTSKEYRWSRDPLL